MGQLHAGFSADAEDGIFGEADPVAKPLAGNFTIETDPMFMPVGFRVGRGAVPDARKEQKCMAGFDGGGKIPFRFKFPWPLEM